MKKAIQYIAYILIVILAIATLLGYADIGNKYADQNLTNGYKTISIKNEHLRILQKGSGKDILFIHGTPGSIEDWTDIIDSLSNDYRVTAFDRPGHGFSTKNEYQYHIEENAAIVEALIQELNLNSPLIVGHSYGGSTAVHLAATHRLDSCRFIVIDSPLYEIELANVYKPLILPVLGKGFAVLANATIASTFIDNGVRKAAIDIPEEKLKAVIQSRKEIWLQPKVLFSRANESANYTEDLQKITPLYKSITAKITIITGENSDLTFKNDCTQFHKEVNHSELVIFENTGHYIQIDRFKELLELIKKS